jgi:hypothetical protein
MLVLAWIGEENAKIVEIATKIHVLIMSLPFQKPIFRLNVRSLPPQIPVSDRKSKYFPKKMGQP